MDGSESLTINDAEIQAALLFSLDNRLPKVKRGTVDYINMFKDSTKTPESVDLVKALHETRVLMETKIESSAPSLREVEASLDEYLPNLYLITWSLRTQPDVPISRALHFEWRGAFTSESNFSRFDVFAYDLVMVLHSKALVHIMRSSMQLRDDPANNTTAAGKGFLAASSILDYLGNSLLPRWPEQDGVPRPCETDARINTALSSYYQASAQKCAVVKGIYYKAGDPTPPGTLAKLSSAVSSLAGVALEAFFNLPTAKQNKVNQLMLAEMNYVRDVYAALTCYYEGCNQLSKEQCGIAIGFFKMAQTHLRQKDGANYFPFPPGLPKLIGPFASAAAGVTKLSILIQRSIDKADKDNRMIYFLSIPPVNEMPPLPSPAIIMTKPAFEEPRKGGHDFVSFHVPIVANSGLTVPMHEPVGGWGAPSTPHSALTNAFATLSTNPTAPPMTAPGNGCPRGRSDSAYARELQARFDAGHET